MSSFLAKGLHYSLPFPSLTVIYCPPPPLPPIPSSFQAEVPEQLETISRGEEEPEKAETEDKDFDDSILSRDGRPESKPDQAKVIISPTSVCLASETG